AFLKLFRQKRKSVEKDLAKKEKERRELDTARLRAAENLLTKAESTPIATGTNMMCGSVTNVTLAREGVTEADAAGTEPSSTSEQGLAHDGVISSVVINREGTLLASAAATHFGDQRPTRDRYAIKIWSTIENKLLHEIDGHQFPIRSLALSHDGQRLVSNSIDGEIRLWSFPDGRLLAT